MSSHRIPSNCQIPLTHYKPTVPEPTSKWPSTTDDTGLCELTKHPKASNFPGQLLQHDNTAGMHQAREYYNNNSTRPRIGGKSSRHNFTKTTKSHLRDSTKSAILYVGKVDSLEMLSGASRPSRRPAHDTERPGPGSVVGATTGLPMERWKQETIRDEPWTAVGARNQPHVGGGPDLAMVRGCAGVLKNNGNGGTRTKSFL